MKKILNLFVISFLITNLFAQKVERIVGPKDAPSFIRFYANNQMAGVVDTITDSETALRTYVYKQQKDAAIKVYSTKDNLGFTHEKFQQYYNGVKVEYGMYSVNKKNNVLHSMNGEYIHVDPNLKTKPLLSENEALKFALEFIGAKKYMWQNPDNELFAKKTEKAGTYYPHGELVIVKNYFSDINEIVLAYKFNIYAEIPLSRDYVYVNANTGKIVHRNPIIKDANIIGNAATRYSGSRAITADSYNGAYRLRESTRNVETYDMNMGTDYNSAVDFTDNDNNWTSAEFNNSSKDNAALDAHWGAEMVWEYWKNVHNRNSYDGNGAILRNYVHFNLVAYGYSNNDNAFWNGSVMTYGDGTTFQPLTCIDIVAHEIGHALTENTSNLIYTGESGALNESISDIWGACVEYYADPSKSTWLLGEEIGGPIRSMSNPKDFGQPDTYKGTNWYTGSLDYGGVHTNSGVLNHWFYILSVGKSGTNDKGVSYNVSGIGINAAAAIVYRMESVYLSPNSRYSNARIYAIQAAEDIYGVGSNEAIQTTNAMDAVGVLPEVIPEGYCISTGTSIFEGSIAKVQIGSYSKVSNNQVYSDFTGDTIGLFAGSTYLINLYHSGGYHNYNRFWKIWIDLNGDEDFSDPNELVFSGESALTDHATADMTVPNVTPIKTRMRVSLKLYSSQTECETFDYGEVEDYTVNINSGNDTELPSMPKLFRASHIVAGSGTSSFDLSWIASTDNVKVTGYNIFINGTLYASTSSLNYTVTGLPLSTYSVAIQAKDAKNNVSGK